MKQRSELLTIRAEAEIILQFSEMVSGALYTSHEMSRVFTGSLRVVCERTHRFRKITGSVNAANLTIREQMPEHITRVFSGISVWKGLNNAFCYFCITFKFFLTWAGLVC